MYSSEKIKSDNYNILSSSLSTGQKVGVDKEGRLYIQKTSHSPLSFIKSFFQSGVKQRRVQEIGIEYALEQFKTKVLTQDEYSSLITRLNFLNPDQRALLAFAWYNKKYLDMKEQMPSKQAQEEIVSEMILDPNIPPEFLDEEKLTTLFWK